MKKLKLLSFVFATVFVFTLFSGMAVTDNGKIESSQENSAIEYYVATNGNDSNDGSKSAPFKTIEAARNAIRELKKSSGLPNGNITVYIRGGYYYLTDVLGFSEEDSGNENCTISYCAYGNEEVIISGGKLIDTSKASKISGEMKNRLRDNTAKSKVVVIDLKAQGITDLGVMYDDDDPAVELFKNGERMTLSRYPNNDFTATLSAPDNRGPKAYLDDNEFGGATCYYSERDSVLDKWTSYEDVFIVGYLAMVDYSDCICPMMGLDKENKCFEIGPGSGEYVCYKNFFFNNVFDELDMPGEYYIDRNTGLMYVYPTSDFYKSEIAVSQFSHDFMLDIDADYITIKGIHFEDTRKSGVHISGDNVTFDDNEITGIRMHAMVAGGNRVKIVNNYLCDLGKCGILFHGGSNTELTPSESYIDNNAILHFGVYGRTYQAGIDVGGNGIIVSHNEIGYAPHEAIEYSGQNIIFEYNRIHDVCTETGDAGAVYSGRTMTRDSCILRYNYIYNIHDTMSANEEGTESGHPCGIYWDDAISGQIAYGNIIYDLGGHGFQIGGGHHNVAYNNIIIDAGYYDDANDSGKAFAIKYDNRAAAGHWAAGLTPYAASGNTMWTGPDSLVQYPYQSVLWQYKFPILALVKETQYNNPADTDVCGNNAYAIVRNNIVVGKRTVGGFEGALASFSTIRDNVLFANKDDVGFVAGYKNRTPEFALAADSPALFEIPYFEHIDSRDMGLRK